MREGFDRDDVYIMVEDEFQIVAQSYTAHLHHAEYKRLVKQARGAAPKALPEPTSPMSKQTKNRLRAAALGYKQNANLQRLMSSRPGLEEEEEEEDTAADLWSGTSLASLMTSGSQKKRSLIGLEGIASTTKASLGVSRSQRLRKDTREEEQNPLDLEHVQHKVPLQRKDSAQLPTSRNVETKVSIPRMCVEPPLKSIDKSVPAHTELVNSTKPEQRPVAKRKFSLDFEDGFDPLSNVSKPPSGSHKSRSVPLSNSNITSKREWKKEKEKKSRLDDVPMFII